MPDPVDCEAVHLRLHGSVQGVGFRAFILGEAERLALDGWVRNRSDGTVEAVLSGQSRDIETMLMRLRSGPPGAHVEHIDIAAAEPPVGPGFRLMRTM